MPSVRNLHITILAIFMCIKIQGDDKILQHKYLKMSIKFFL